EVSLLAAIDTDQLMTSHMKIQQIKGHGWWGWRKNMVGSFGHGLRVLVPNFRSKLRFAASDLLRHGLSASASMDELPGSLGTSASLALRFGQTISLRHTLAHRLPSGSLCFRQRIIESEATY
ncbi:Hypothetical predicted protein, partial [Prunus dulcis]